MKNQQKPWLNSEGKRLSDKELLEAAKSWGGATWEEFLRSTVEGPLRENLIQDNSTMDQFNASYLQAYQDLLVADQTHPTLRTHIRSLVGKLTIRERTVIYGIFWEGKTQAELAQTLHIKRSAVRNYRDQALKKLGVQMIKKSLMVNSLTEEQEVDCPPVFATSNL